MVVLTIIDPLEPLINNSMIEDIVGRCDAKGTSVGLEYLAPLVVPYCLARIKYGNETKPERTSKMKRRGKFPPKDNHTTRYFIAVLEFARYCDVDDSLFDAKSFKCQACRAKLIYQMLLKFGERPKRSEGSGDGP